LDNFNDEHYNIPEAYSETDDRADEAAESVVAAVSADDGEERPAHRAGESAKDFFKSLVIDVVVAVILAAIVLFFIRPTIVKQTSMENTLHENDYMIMYRQAYRSHGPERGDIIIFQSSMPDENTGQNKLLIKRVIGLPGDDLSIINDQLYLNGSPYEEDYLKDGYTPAFETPAEGETYTVPDNMYFVMGDNRAGSIDSRRSEVGMVSPEQIEGKVILRLFPFNRIQRF
jgi:signal peptidase I